MSLFSPELFKLESSNMLYVCRISDCIVGLRSGSWLLFFYFDPFFFLSPNYKLTLKIRVRVSQELLQLQF